MDKNDLWVRAAKIATEAAELPPNELEPFLDQACPEGSDDELRPQVEMLLATRVLGTETVEAPEFVGPLAGAPETIGPYRLIRSLGQGGMGEVYLAEQEEPIQRQVAIKLIRPTHRGRASRRFELERQALARMSHPCIAQVFEAGDTEDGLPYLVMELVDGISIDTYCDENRLSVEDRLELFAAVCDGIHHAHQKGVLHRDIKPNNVLITTVDGRPAVKIIDFGIAKTIDEDHLDDRFATKAGVIVGTPAYLSPEAIQLPASELDIRTDVYSLGILLFALSTGELPFVSQTSSWLEVLQKAGSEDTKAPSRVFADLDIVHRLELAELRGLHSPKALLSRLRGDLDATALKATARDRADRYNSAAQLASEIRRLLAHLPIEARSATQWYGARKFIRRHRAGVAAVVLTIASLVAGIVARTQEARRADRAAEEAIRAQLETEQVLEFLIDLFEVSAPARSLGATITARELLDTGAERLRQDLQDQPRARARLMDTIGVVYGKLGIYDEAIELLKESLAQREELASDPLDIADSLNHLAFVYWTEGETAKARPLFERALSIRTRELDANHPDVAEVLGNLGMNYELAAQFEEADQLLQQALDIREQVIGPESPEAAETLNHLAISAFDQGHFEVARSRHRRVLDIQEKLHGPSHPDVARALNGLALALFKLDELEEAEGLFRRSLAIREEIFGPDHPEVGQSLNNLSNVLDQQNRAEESVALLMRAIEISRTSGRISISAGINIYNLGDVYTEQGRFDEAEPLIREALQIFEQIQGPDHPRAAFAWKRLGDIALERGNPKEAERRYQRAFEIRIEKMPSDHPQLISTAHQLAAVKRRLGRVEEADSLEADYPQPAEDGTELSKRD